MNIIEEHNFVDLKDYIIPKELCSKAGLTQYAYKSWKNLEILKLSRYHFLHKNNVPEKYKKYVDSCTNLNGMLPFSFWYRLMGVSSGFYKTVKNRENTKYKTSLNIVSVHDISMVIIDEKILEELKRGKQIIVLSGTSDCSYCQSLIPYKGVIYCILEDY